MRIQLLLVVAACGNVKSSASQPEPPADAAPVDAVPVDATPVDAMSSCSIKIMDPLPPAWLLQGPFVQAADPAGRGAQVWISNSHVPSAASFTVPFVVGDRITGLVFDAFGNGSNSGLQHIEVIYQPDGAAGQNLGSGDDLGRKAQWGQVGFTGFQPAVLSRGALWVQFDVSEVGYYVGMVTATFEHPWPCPSGK